MLGKIAEGEKRISELKTEGDALHRECQIIKLEGESLIINNKEDQVDLSQEEKEFSSVS